MSELSLSAAQQLLHREAWLLDHRQFDEWLDLYQDDCTFWVPARRIDGSLTENPARELSLIYYKGLSNLRDRVDRLRSNQSPASRPPARVVHLLSNISIENGSLEIGKVTSSFVSHAFHPRTDSVSIHFGHYEHGVRWDGRRWRISSKVIHLANDLISTVLDINEL